MDKVFKKLALRAGFVSDNYYTASDKLFMSNAKTDLAPEGDGHTFW